MLYKLCATLLLPRMELVVPLHDHQCAFRRERQPQANVQSGSLAAHPCGHRVKCATLFDAAKAYDAVSHDLMLARLVDKDVHGNLFHPGDQLCACSQSDQGRQCLSEPFQSQPAGCGTGLPDVAVPVRCDCELAAE
jgi:hypothetical protein